MNKNIHSNIIIELKKIQLFINHIMEDSTAKKISVHCYIH